MWWSESNFTASVFVAEMSSSSSPNSVHWGVKQNRFHSSTPFIQVYLSSKCSMFDMCECCMPSAQCANLWFSPGGKKSVDSSTRHLMQIRCENYGKRSKGGKWWPWIPENMYNIFLAAFMVSEFQTDTTLRNEGVVRFHTLCVVSDSQLLPHHIIQFDHLGFCCCFCCG